jgi:hypothetical protein
MDPSSLTLVSTSTLGCGRNTLARLSLVMPVSIAILIKEKEQGLVYTKILAGRTK